jgi:hypothetical protein
VTSERALLDAAILISRPGNAPVVEKEELLGTKVDKPINDILIGEEVRSFYGVPGVQIEGVAFLGVQNRRGTSFGGS